MDPDSIALAIENFVRNAGAVAIDDASLTRTTHLFDAGYVDSVTLVALSVFIEETFNVPVDEHDLFDPGFTTIGGMAKLVSSRLGDA
ncbi:acyl carrier protein [Cryptosporangium sp. NPDC048952]|uniref:acyl carrier protein n=1 Tax=Cryptosporangium sp. NPDC048952 TaxID=3363961 RepID=UPI0037184C8A